MKPIAVLWRMVRFAPWWFTLTTLWGAFIFVLVPITVGLATRAFFDALAGPSTGLNPWTAIVVFVAIQVLEAFSGPLLGNPWNAMQQTNQVMLARNLFAGVMRGFGRFGLRTSVGETISLMRDDPRVMADSLDALSDLIGRSIFTIGATYLMWRIDPLMTTVLLVPILGSSVIAHLLSNRIAKYRIASREATQHLTAFLGELVGAQLAVKVAGGTGRAVDRLRSMGETRRRASVRDHVFEQALDSIHYHLAFVAIGVVLLLGAHGMRNGTFTVGDFALFVLFLDQLMFVPTEIGRLIFDLRRIDVSMTRMHEVVPGDPPSALVADDPVFLGSTLPDVEPEPERERLERLEVAGLSYDHNDVRGIADVSFTIERGSFTVITGRIGSGKTTLVHALLGLVQRDGGEIVWNGRTIDDPSAFFVPPRSAYTPQVPRLFSETLRENLLLGRPDAASDVDAAVHAAVLEADVATLEGGLDTMIGPRGVRLSGGQVQRAAAARMFVREAELLVFDDLSSALDATTEMELWSRLFKQGSDVTCLVVSHRPVALRRADQVLLMDEGRLVATGPLEQLLATQPAMRSLWHDEEETGES